MLKSWMFLNAILLTLNFKNIFVRTSVFSLQKKMTELDKKKGSIERSLGHFFSLNKFQGIGKNVPKAN